jgi:hypothetical protein
LIHKKFGGLIHLQKDRRLKMPDIMPMERITGKIYLIRKMKVMIDRDLAKLYGVETRVIN